MKHPHLSNDTLSAYLDGEVSPRVAQDVASHLFHCGFCVERLESLGKASKVLRALPRAEPPAALGQSVRQRMSTAEAQPGLFDRILEPLLALRLVSLPTPLGLGVAGLLMLVTLGYGMRIRSLSAAGAVAGVRPEAVESVGSAVTWMVLRSGDRIVDVYRIGAGG
jgi:anti-sigma factor RsiW